MGARLRRRDQRRAPAAGARERRQRLARVEARGVAERRRRDARQGRVHGRQDADAVVRVAVVVERHQQAHAVQRPGVVEIVAGARELERREDPLGGEVLQAGAARHRTGLAQHHAADADLDGLALDVAQHAARVGDSFEVPGAVPGALDDPVEQDRRQDAGVAGGGPGIGAGGVGTGAADRRAAVAGRDAEPDERGDERAAARK